MPQIPTYQSRATPRPLPQTVGPSTLTSIVEAVGPRVEEYVNRVRQSENQTLAIRAAGDFAGRVNEIYSRVKAENPDSTTWADSIEAEARPIIEEYLPNVFDFEARAQVKEALEKQLIRAQAGALEEADRFSKEKQLNELEAAYNTFESNLNNARNRAEEDMARTNMTEALRSIEAIVGPAKANDMLQQSRVNRIMGVANRSPGQALAMLNSEEYADLPGATKVTLQNRIEAEGRQQMLMAKQQQSLNLATKRELLQSDPSQFTEEMIDQMNDLSPDGRRIMKNDLRRYNRQMQDTVSALSRDQAVTQGLAAYDPTDAQDRKAADAVFASMLPKNATPEQVQASLDEFVASRQIVPQSVLDGASAVLAQTGASTELRQQSFSQLYRFDSLTGGQITKMIDKDTANTYNRIAARVDAGLSLQEAFKINDIIEQQPETDRRVEAIKSFEKLTEDPTTFVASNVSTPSLMRSLQGLLPGNPFSTVPESEMRSAVKGMWVTAFQEQKGDVPGAKRMVQEMVRAQFSLVNEDGNLAVKRRPLSNYYTKFGMTDTDIRQQFESMYTPPAQQKYVLQTDMQSQIDQSAAILIYDEDGRMIDNLRDANGVPLRFRPNVNLRVAHREMLIDAAIKDMPVGNQILGAPTNAVDFALRKAFPTAFLSQEQEQNIAQEVGNMEARVNAP